MSELEARYLVIKLDGLPKGALSGVQRILQFWEVKPVEGLVVEKDWPMYEEVKTKILEGF